MAEALWSVGTLTVPGSTGSQSVTGMESQPAAVFFFGTNWLTEDAKVSTAHTGLFRGMCAPLHDDPDTLVQSAACVIPTGDAHSMQSHAIHQLDTSGNATSATLYQADVASLNSDGFTLTWNTVASGGYQVVYAALMDVTEIGAYLGGSATITLGWKAGASLIHGAWAGPSVDGDNRTQEWYGGAAYPGASGGQWLGAGLTAGTFPSSISQQYVIGLDVNAPTTIIANTMTFTGPFLDSQNLVCYPTGTSGHDLLFNTNLSDNQGMVVVWDDEHNMTGKLGVPSTNGSQVTVSGLEFPPGLVIGYTVSDEPDGQGTGGAGAVGFSVITPDFQWTAIADHGEAYQSFQRGICDVVDSSGVHTATVELTSDGFIVTTDDDDVSPDEWAWHAFGHSEISFIPQFYRLLPGGMIATISVPINFAFESGSFAIQAPGATLVYVPFIGFLLLENGDQIILEDGSGFLLL